MKNSFLFISLLLFLSLFLISCSNSSNPVNNPATISNNNSSVTPLLKGGFNEFGYNYGARIFNGPADGVDKILDGKVWGDPTYANDNLVMKWTADWDRGVAEDWSKPPYLSAWEDNEWNGKVPNGSGQVWHYKIIWVGSALENSPYWRTGGYSVWDQFEVIMDQGQDPSMGPGHIWFAHATPNGF